ncbi:hypothetical protein COO60DRAFT_1532616, partial [Scenedesmus sp. NREL 46B-D3]
MARAGVTLLLVGAVAFLASSNRSGHDHHSKAFVNNIKSLTCSMKPHGAPQEPKRPSSPPQNSTSPFDCDPLRYL